MTKKPQNQFLFALTGMEKIHSNYFDSAHWLFGIIEKKYALPLKEARKLLKTMKPSYNILQIQDETHFDYKDVYLDTLDHDFFKWCNKKNDHKINARTRHNSTNTTWVFQVIDRANKRKSVYHFTPGQADQMFTNETLTFFNGVYTSIKGNTPTFLPFPNIVVSFKRIILYNKAQNERVNIDYDISFKNVRGKHSGEEISLWQTVIVETKTLDNHNFIDRFVKKYKAKKIKKLNKFLIWMHTVWWVSLKWKYKKELSKIDAIITWK